MTSAEYLRWEDKQSRPHEYADGRVYGQAGASRWHGRIVTNLVARLDQQLHERPCDVYANEMRLHVQSYNSYYYPDVMVVCGESNFLADTFDTLTNPNLLIEVFSRSTRGVDDVTKRRHYRTIPSLGEYLLVDQYAVGIERLRRVDDAHWDSVNFQSLDQTIELTSVGCQLVVADIYRRVEFDGDLSTEEA